MREDSSNSASTKLTNGAGLRVEAPRPIAVHGRELARLGLVEQRRGADDALRAGSACRAAARTQQARQLRVPAALLEQVQRHATPAPRDFGVQSAAVPFHAQPRAPFITTRPLAGASFVLRRQLPRRPLGHGASLRPARSDAAPLPGGGTRTARELAASPCATRRHRAASAGTAATLGREIARGRS